MGIDREELEQRAKEVCTSEEWYDLLDTIDETPDDDLHRLIAENYVS